MHFPWGTKGIVHGVLKLVGEMSYKSYNDLLCLLQEHSSFLTQLWPSSVVSLSSIWN